jgi:hypothetical protein
MSRSWVGSREWHAQFDRERRRFDRVFPFMAVLAVVCAVAMIVLVATGVLPLWVLFIG